MRVKSILIFSVFLIGSVSFASGSKSGGAKITCYVVSPQINGTLTSTSLGTVCTPLPAGSTVLPNCVAAGGVSKCGVKPKGF